ncbi:MAG: dihydropteroate synthase [Gammaproteobacteria bacterium HGW-Gammaproteobacteria-2]|nr:MAG: dihydropteroate synthase [Gammaproteobacteria bacterium HGW-Gammaproteobacteria-2]
MFSDPSIRTLDCAGRVLSLDRPRVMGIVNVTPDSFSDGGCHADTDAAVAYALDLVEQGADLLDVGGESTRPGADAVPLDVELARVLPVIERLAAQCSVPISVDTRRCEVMRAAVAAGAGMINDVSALAGDGALDAAAQLGVPVVLMHMRGEPRMMQDAPHYADVVAEVHSFLAQRIFACEMSGIDKKRMLVDPGFGFGKLHEHNLALLANLRRFADLGVPLMVGLSRKRLIERHRRRRRSAGLMTIEYRALHETLARIVRQIAQRTLWHWRRRCRWPIIKHPDNDFGCGACLIGRDQCHDGCCCLAPFRF